MIARKSSTYICIAAAILLLFSCKKSFLNKIPESSLTTGNFPQSAVDAESELTGAYDWMVFYTNFYQYDNYFFFFGAICDLAEKTNFKEGVDEKVKNK